MENIDTLNEMSFDPKAIYEALKNLNSDSESRIHVPGIENGLMEKFLVQLANNNWNIRIPEEAQTDAGFNSDEIYQALKALYSDKKSEINPPGIMSGLMEEMLKGLAKRGWTIEQPPSQSTLDMVIKEVRSRIPFFRNKG